MKQFNDIITDIPRKLKSIDDMVLHNSSVEEAFWYCIGAWTTGQQASCPLAVLQDAAPSLLPKGHSDVHDEPFPHLVIPASLCQIILNNLRAGHQDRDSMLHRARQSVYWHGTDAEVEQKRPQCPLCEMHFPSHPAEPLLSTPPPHVSVSACHRRPVPPGGRTPT
ncbi:hypothetical protein E2C01_039544 [Portunus trituberculatus]|uniref:RNA-directed DNA polymerase n=1 Tax=Portunus trituberculatus TaxID=210409 RepID=A0A5B7FLM2_PORTR|nr:hypothetical protein [Portunus trituberculatus]